MTPQIAFQTPTLLSKVVGHHEPERPGIFFRGPTTLPAPRGVLHLQKWPFRLMVADNFA